MKTFSTVEDYLEVIAGKRDITGTVGSSAANLFGFYEFKPIVSLARYDVSFLDSVTDSTLGGSPLTDRQAELALKIVAKYQRQLAQLQISVDAIVSKPIYRHALRVIDRSRMIKIENGEILIYFPYESKLIEFIRDAAKDSQGRVKFDKEHKVWRAALTEYNLNWIYAFSQQFDFQRTAQVNQIMQEIFSLESQPYRIELVAAEDHLSISNAPDALLQYLGSASNKFDHDRLPQLIDSSQVLGYTVHDDLVQLVTDQYGSDMSIMLQSRAYDFKYYNWPNFEHKVIEYAEISKRFPIVVFDPQAEFGPWRGLVSSDQVLDLTQVQTKEEAQVCRNTAAKVILCNRAVKYIDRIPLLISHVGMIVGQDKRIMLDASEKIFFRNGKLT